LRESVRANPRAGLFAGKRRRYKHVMKIYTRTGDDGTTGLRSGARVSKANARVEACGELDEASAAIGMARSTGLAPDADAVLQQAQKDLSAIGSEVSGGDEIIAEADATRLERAIDAVQEGLPPLRSLVLPGGSPASCALHVARCVVRRAERRVAALEERHEPIAYLNRLSDLLFVLARRANLAAGVGEIPWP
jgi:cob(I)alamin adenosyltransferase